MSRKLFALILFVALLLLLTLISLRDILLPSFAYGIGPNGSVNPSTLAIERNQKLYTLTGDLGGGVFTVQRSNIVIEGNGYQSGPIKLDHVNNVTIQNLIIESSRWTIHLDHSSNNKIVNTNQNGHPMSLGHSNHNIITNNTNLVVWIFNSKNNTVQNNILNGIELTRSINNRVLENDVPKGERSTWLDISDSKNNLIFRNQINNGSSRWIAIFGTSTKNLIVANQVTGPFVLESAFQSTGNLFYHNNFIDAFQFIHASVDENNQTNQWDKGQHGNYWNNYQGEDANNDGIGDIPHRIYPYNQDNYPLIAPISLETETQPQLAPLQTETIPIPTTTLAAVLIVIVLVLGIGLHKRKAIVKALAKIDTLIFTLAALFSILGGLSLLISVFYGFGSYLTYPFRGGYGTSGQIHRLSLIFLATLAASLIPTGFGYRKLVKTHQDPTSTYQLLPAIITAILLLIAASLLATANQTFLTGTSGPYWNLCFFQDIDNSITFTQLTFIIFILIGITQILWGRTQQKSQSYTQHPKLNKNVGKIQTASGIITLAYTLFFIMPMITGLFCPLPISLLFLLTQTLSATTFLYSKKEVQKLPIYTSQTRMQ